MRTEIKRPGECYSRETTAFTELVLGAEEIDPIGFDQRVASAERLVFIYDEPELAGVAAVKRPTMRHKRSVFENSESPEDPALFALEVGWIVVKESFRNRRLSRNLLSDALSVVGNANVFATVRTNNERMRRTIERFGFQVSGQPFLTNRLDRKYSLSLLSERRLRTPRKHDVACD